MGAAGLIGRDAPRARLADAAARAADGLGSLVLVAGPAGIGKTALLDDVLAGSALSAVRATAPAGGSQAWGPVVAALRAARRRDPASIAVPATLAPHLALLLPETGVGADASDRATVVEAVLAAFATLAATAPTAVVLDDLQWADHATCELLPVLAAASADQPLLVLAAYRSEALARGHPLRAARQALRRAGALREELSCSRSIRTAPGRSRGACSASPWPTPSPSGCTPAPAACPSRCWSSRRRSRAAPTRTRRCRRPCARRC